MLRLYKLLYITHIFTLVVHFQFSVDLLLPHTFNFQLQHSITPLNIHTQRNTHIWNLIMGHDTNWGNPNEGFGGL